jgi:DNA-binding transcriptional LysR family regulator
MELRHLRYFVAVAEELSFRRAVALLHVAQPALSQQIRQLEEELRVRLLERNRRTVSLTDAGRAFLDKARATLLLAGDAVRAAQQADRGEIGKLSIGFVTSALYGVFPDIVRRFRQRFPDVHIDLHEMPVSAQTEVLRNKKIDVSILRPPVDEQGLVVQTILDEHWVIAMPASHPSARQPVVALGTVSRDPFILFPRNLAPSLYDGILAMCQEAGFSPNIVLEAQMQTIISLVAAGIGVALVPESLKNLRRKGLVYKTLKQPSAKVSLAVAWRDEPMRPALRSFLAVVAEATSHAGGRFC